MDFIKDLRPPFAQPDYLEAVRVLRKSKRTVIAQIDSGIASHPSLGYKLGAAHDDPPKNILLDRGRNFFDPERDPRPLSSLKRTSAFLSNYVEHPDHGVKTLSAIIGKTAKFRGVAPGAWVIPYRVSNGALFRREIGGGPVHAASTRTIGEAIYHALQYNTVRVINISMGNPARLGPIFGTLTELIGAENGMDPYTASAIDAAYDRGVIVVAAAGQVIKENVYPGVYSRTIAVGGYDNNNNESYTHYPPWEYRLPKRVDIWARAERLNRAAFDLDAKPPRPIYADDPQSDTSEPSGTSYAAAQVSAVAALWIERYSSRLEELFSGQRYKIVESFRASLSTYNNTNVEASVSGGKTTIKILDIDKVLKNEPVFNEVAPAPLAKNQ